MEKGQAKMRFSGQVKWLVLKIRAGYSFVTTLKWIGGNKLNSSDKKIKKSIKFTVNTLYLFSEISSGFECRV